MIKIDKLKDLIQRIDTIIANYDALKDMESRGGIEQDFMAVISDLKDDLANFPVLWSSVGLEPFNPPSLSNTQLIITVAQITSFTKQVKEAAAIITHPLGEFVAILRQMKEMFVSFLRSID